MSPKAILFSLGCLLTWFVVLPVIIIVGGATLFAYAMFTELGLALTGITEKNVDPSAARLAVRQKCGGYSVQARDPRRSSAP